LAAIVALLTAAAGLVAVSDSVEAAPAEKIYDDEIGHGYQDWSWATVRLASTVEVNSGSAAIAVDFGPWEGLYLARPTPTGLDPSATLEFWMHGGSGSTDPIEVALVGPTHQAGTTVTIEPTPGRWTRHQIPVSSFGLTGDTFGGLWWMNGTGAARATIHIDDVGFIGGTDRPREPGDGTGPALTVDLGPRSITRTITDPASGISSDVAVSFPHPIADGVYGLNFAAPTLLEEIDPGINRWGGNAVERYNHLNGNTNRGKDWFFMNTPGEPGDEHRFETANQAAGADTLLTVPATGWIAADDAARCGYPLSQYAPMDASQPHFLDPGLQCGNGQRGGQTISGQPETTSIAVGPSHTTDWVRDLVATHGSAADGGVEIYAVGNEPGLWHQTHADVVDAPTTRQQIITTNVEQANAIKAGDPTASVAGPVLWSGYSYYVTSAELEAGQRPGDVPTFVADYLASMSSASADAGRRLLDTLAINFYDDRVYGGGSDELRLEATRNLWDPAYDPQDWWVARDFARGASAVIPRMQSLIDENYPGTELSITEYNFGSLDTLVGGLAQADALGIFGREGLDRAMLWDPFNDQQSGPEADFVNTPGMWAFRMYRNYDGAGSRFGETSLFAQSADQDVLSVYGARRSSDGAVTIMVINKSTQDQVSTLSIDLTGRAEVHRYGDQGLTSIERHDDLAVDGGVTTLYPAHSITLLTIHPDASPPTTVPVTTVPPTTAPSTTGPSTTGPSTTVTIPVSTSSTTTPTTTRPTDDPTLVFSEDFVDDDSFDRFEADIYHRDDWVMTETSWEGDHRPTGPNDACSSPMEKRQIERGNRVQGFDQGWIYRCRPGGDAAKAHLMTSIGDTSGYSIGAFTPTVTFEDVSEVRWEVNITDLGSRQFPEVKIMPAATFDFQNLPCSIDWLPCHTDNHDDLGSVGTSFFHAEPAINTGAVFVNGYDWDSGWRDTAGDPARQSFTTRRSHFFRDNGDGTLTFGVEKADGSFETVSAPGSFPEGEVRVVFADHNYTPRKDLPPGGTFTWHWDDIQIFAR